MYEHDSYIIIENSVNGIGTDAAGEEFPKGSVFNKFSVNAHGRINKEIAYYEVSDSATYIKNYTEIDAREGSQAEIDYMTENNTQGKLTNLLEIVADYSYGVADIEINEEFFATKAEVEEQLN